MSRNNQGTNKDKTKLIVRVLAFILAFLMVAGLAYSMLYMLITPIGADDTSTNVDTSPLKGNDDVMVSVGLMYGSNITTGFETTVEEGYHLGIQSLSGTRDFKGIWDLYTTKISCTADSNLSKSGMTYSIANSNWVSVGGYHIQIDCDMYNRAEVESLIAETQQDVWNLGLYIIPSYIYTGYALRIGDFATWNEAEAYLDDIKWIFNGEIISIVEPEETAVSIVDPDTDLILFEYDCGGRSELGIQAMKDNNGNSYIRTPAGNYYDGTFCFKRHNNGTVDGVALINILPLEAYVAGVLPYEIPNTWPLETLKAFAITIRSFTLTHLGKHSKNNFDLCNSVDCQVYSGVNKVTERVFNAVYETAGQVIAYEGDIVTAYYSSSVGGVTVSSKDAWGGSNDIPYLKAVETPWENYMVHNNAFWIYEATPSEIQKELYDSGYTSLTGEIAEITIKEFAENSTYIKVLEVTDVYGNTVLIKNSDKIRTSLSPIVKSANFVVGRGSVEYTENVVTTAPDEDDTELPDDNVDIGGDDNEYDKDYGYIDVDEMCVQTADGTEYYHPTDGITIMTASGEIENRRPAVFVITKENASAFTDVSSDSSDNIEELSNDEDKDDYSISLVSSKSTDEVVYKIAYAENKNNFIFVGKGWGHGVGISQYGAHDLAALGKSAEEILLAYFNGIEIIDYTESNDFN